MQKAAGVEAVIQYGPPRAGDVRDSLADISAARKALGFEPEVELSAGLSEYWSWIRQDPLSNR
jgi:nucleoside-diphosphate-sugar epimerase